MPIWQKILIKIRAIVGLHNGRVILLVLLAIQL